MKVNWGWLELHDFGGGGTKDNPFVLQLKATSQYNDKDGPQRSRKDEGYIYLTPEQAKRVAAKLIQWAKKKNMKPFNFNEGFLFRWHGNICVCHFHNFEGKGRWYFSFQLPFTKKLFRFFL